MHDIVGFLPEEIDTGAPTRAARLKWVLIVDGSLPAGIAANAAVCTAAATAVRVSGLLGQDAVDAEDGVHPGLPWAGVSVLRASAEQLVGIRAKAQAAEDVFVADMPAAAQLTRVYDEYLRTVEAAASADLPYYAVSVVGPRNRVDRIVGRLALL
ncbi:hypothetical protein A0130_16565 [Leifsonia xyli]|uniref:DUF2000 domain-containing protein n=1 Tax=Leifsonia xyli TaxID=1575 RepID=UPI0007CE01A5|nr:hypothetical protein A0130_16565 [Leifsonia xyli]